MRNDSRKWVDNLIEEAETAANKGHMKTVYEITKVIIYIMREKIL